MVRCEQINISGSFYRNKCGVVLIRFGEGFGVLLGVCSEVSQVFAQALCNKALKRTVSLSCSKSCVL